MNATTPDVSPTGPWCLRHRGRYAHRLRAIGHLHEAEDESQKSPVLHAAIRAARKAYQTDGTIPDWQSLEALVNEVRPAE